MDVKEIEDLTWTAINAETRKIHDRDNQLRKILAQHNIKQMEE